MDLKRLADIVSSSDCEGLEAWLERLTPREYLIVERATR